MASLVHPSSAESVTSQLDLFSVQPTQTFLEEGHFTEYHPVSVLISEGPIEFCVAAENSKYLDFANTLLYVRASIVDQTGANLEAGVECAPETNFLHTLWSQIELYLNGTLVTPSTNNYPYRSFIENLLSFGAEAKESQLSSILWHQNTSGHFDERGDANVGYAKRKALAAGSRQFEMLGPLHLDLTFQNRYLLNGMEVRLRLIRSKDIFCLHGNQNQRTNKVSLKEVILFCRKVKPNPSIQLAHAEALKQGTARYPIRRVEVKSFSVPMGNRSISKENLFLGQLPTRVIIGAVDNNSYNGEITKSPFNFKHNNINFVSLHRDGIQIPSKPLQPDFENDRFIRSYMRLFSQTGQHYRNTGNGISRDQYKNGCALFAFDMTPQTDSSDASFELIKHGNMRLEIHFSAAVAQTLTVIVFAEFDNLLEIDRDRHVAFDYTA